MGARGLSAVEAGKLAEQQARLVQALEGRLAASVAKANELSARGAALERDNAELQRRVRESEAAAAAAQRRGEAVMQHAVEVLQDKAVAGAPRGAPAARAARGGAAAAAGGVLAGGERFHLRAELLELQPMAPRPRSGLEPQHADLSLGGDCADYPRASSAESPGLTPRRDASPHAPDAAGARARARALSSAPWPVTLHHPAATAVAGDASPASVGGGVGVHFEAEAPVVSWSRGQQFERLGAPNAHSHAHAPDAEGARRLPLPLCSPSPSPSLFSFSLSLSLSLLLSRCVSSTTWGGRRG